MKRRLRFLLDRYQRFLRRQLSADCDDFSATHKYRAAEELVEIFRFLTRTELDLCQMVGRQFRRIVDGYSHRLAVRGFNEIHLVSSHGKAVLEFRFQVPGNFSGSYFENFFPVYDAARSMRYR